MSASHTTFAANKSTGLAAANTHRPSAIEPGRIDMAARSQSQPPQPLEPAMKQAMSSSQEKVSGGFTAVNQSYLTPPHDIHHSFSSEDANEHSRGGQSWDNKLPPLQERSPPVSPDAPVLPSISQMAATAGTQSTDPPLYPDEPNQAARFDTPLFPTAHFAHPTSSPPSKATDLYSPTLKTPTPEPSPKLPVRSRLTFPQRLAIKSPKEAFSYYSDCLNEVMSLRGLPDPRTLRKNGDRVELDSTSRRQLDRFHSARVTKPTKAASKPAKGKAPASMVAPVTAPSVSPKLPIASGRKRATRARSEVHDSPSPASQAQQSNKHTRAPPSKKNETDHLHWTQIEDYSPPISTLDNTTAKFVSHWGHSPLDLSNDPDRHHLHPLEVELAQTLRFTCAQYLANKRKIFKGKLDFLQKDKKNFPKTEAQKVCKIDVNKTSRLWMAFDSVGWFDEKWFEKWLPQ